MTLVFALEVVADHISVQCAECTSSASANALRPAVGIRCLDLPAVVVDAPAGQGFPAAGGRIPFQGRGKALLFELPLSVLEGASNHTPVPLWLTALARPQAAVGPEQAFLVGSACLDLRAEASCAAASRPSSLNSPIPYRVCTVGMTSARGLNDALRLQCRLRLFRVHSDPESRQGIRSGETRLEHQPAVVEPAQQCHPSISHTSTADGPSGVVSKRAAAASVAVQANCMSSVATQTDEHQANIAPAPTLSGTHAETPSYITNSWTDLAKAREQPRSQLLQLPGEVRIGRVSFPDEVHVLPLAPGAPPVVEGNAVQPLQPVCVSETKAPSAAKKDAIQTIGASAAAAQPGSPHVTNRESSLPLVAELTRELCQLQEAAFGQRKEFDAVSLSKKKKESMRSVEARVRHIAVETQAALGQSNEFMGI